MFFSRLIIIYFLLTAAFHTPADGKGPPSTKPLPTKMRFPYEIGEFEYIYVSSFECTNPPSGSDSCDIEYGTQFDKSTRVLYHQTTLDSGKTRISLYSYANIEGDSKGIRLDYDMNDSSYDYSPGIIPIESSNSNSLTSVNAYFSYSKTELEYIVISLSGTVLLDDLGEYYFQHPTKPHRHFKVLAENITEPLEFLVEKKVATTDKLCFGFAGILDWGICKVMFGRFYDYKGHKYIGSSEACRSHNAIAIKERVIITTQIVDGTFMLLIKNEDEDVWTLGLKRAPKEGTESYRGLPEAISYRGLDSVGLIHSNDFTLTEELNPDNLEKYIVLTGTYTSQQGYGVFDFDNTSGSVFLVANIDNHTNVMVTISAATPFSYCVVIGSLNSAGEFTLLSGLYANVDDIYWNNYRDCVKQSELKPVSRFQIWKKDVNGLHRYFVVNPNSSGVTFDIHPNKSQSLLVYYLVIGSGPYDVDQELTEPFSGVPLVSIESDKYSFDTDGYKGDHHPFYVAKERSYRNLISLADAVNTEGQFIPIEMQLTPDASTNFVCFGVSNVWLSPEQLYFLHGVFWNGYSKLDDPENACKDSNDTQIRGTSNIRVQYVDETRKLRILMWTSEGKYFVYEHENESLYSVPGITPIFATHIGVIHSNDLTDFHSEPVVGDMRQTIPVGVLQDGDYPDLLTNGRYFRKIGNISSDVQDFTVPKLASQNVICLGIGRVTDSLPYLLSAAFSDGDKVYFENLDETLYIPTPSPGVPGINKIRVQRVGDEVLAAVYIDNMRKQLFRVNDADTSEPFNIVVVMHHKDIGEVTTSIPEVRDQCVC